MRILPSISQLPPILKVASLSHPWLGAIHREKSSSGCAELFILQPEPVRRLRHEPEHTLHGHQAKKGHENPPEFREIVWRYKKENQCSEDRQGFTHASKRKPGIVDRLDGQIGMFVQAQFTR